MLEPHGVVTHVAIDELHSVVVVVTNSEEIEETTELSD